jgi:hypothetical protein
MSVADPKCFVRLKEPIPGTDHINFIDQREFAETHHLIDTIAGQLGVDRINDFYVYKGEYGSHSVKWHTAADGLAAMRAVKDYNERHEAMPELATLEYRVRTLNVLNRLEELLAEADSRDIRFCIVGNY